jgi:hypothetical protein
MMITIFISAFFIYKHKLKKKKKKNILYIEKKKSIVLKWKTNRNIPNDFNVHKEDED